MTPHRHFPLLQPGDSQELVGVNVGGLHADLKTNLFAADGPFAQLGNELMSGASKLQAELDSGAKALQANLNSASNLVVRFFLIISKIYICIFLYSFLLLRIVL